MLCTVFLWIFPCELGYRKDPPEIFDPLQPNLPRLFPVHPPRLGSHSRWLAHVPACQPHNGSTARSLGWTRADLRLLCRRLRAHESLPCSRR